jgi:hypothetical protein
LSCTINCSVQLVHRTVTRKKKKAKIKRSEHLFPNWSEGVAFTIFAKALESDGYDVTLTNLAPGLIYGELSKTTQRVMCFLMHGFRTRTKITGLWCLGIRRSI